MKSRFINSKEKDFDVEKRRKEGLKRCKKCAFYDKEVNSCYAPHRLPKNPTDWEAYGEAFLESHFRRGALECEYLVSKSDKAACELREKNKKALNQGHERLEQIRAQERERKEQERREMERQQQLEQERKEQERKEKELQRRIEQEKAARQKKLEEFNTYLARAKKGNADSMCKVAQSYAHGYGVEKDIENAKEWFVKAFKAGNKNAEPNMRDLFGDTETDRLINPIIEERRKKQEQERQQAQFNKSLERAKAGNVDEMYQTAMNYRNGFGTPISSNSAAEWLYRAIQKGHEGACAELRKALKEKVISSDMVDEYQRIVDDYYRKKEEEMARIKREREIAEQKKRELMRQEQERRDFYLLRAKTNPSADELVRLSKMYFDGYGTEKDILKSVETCFAALEAGKNDIEGKGKAAAFLGVLIASKDKSEIDIATLTKMEREFNNVVFLKDSLVRKMRNGDPEACADLLKLNEVFQSKNELEVEVYVRQYWIETRIGKTNCGWNSTLERAWKKLEEMERSEYYNRYARQRLSSDVQNDWDRVLIDAPRRKEWAMGQRKQAEAEREEAEALAKARANGTCGNCYWYHYYEFSSYIDEFDHVRDSPVKIVEETCGYDQDHPKIYSGKKACSHWEPRKKI